jgi:hypothetical protein
MAALVGHLGEGDQGVEGAHRAPRLAEGGRFRGHRRADLPEQLELEPGHALFRSEHPALVFLELGRDIALCAHEGLAPNVLGGHLGRVGVAHLDAVAEDAVEAHAEGGDARALTLTLLQ